MTQLKFKDDVFTVSAGSTVLDTLIDQGHEIPNSCRAGACQSCVMQVTKGSVPENAQNGLKDSQKAKGFFLACSCEPKEDIEIQLIDAEQLRTAATVSNIHKLSADVIELKIKTTEPYDYNPGQFVTLWKDDLFGRSYSIASLPKDDNTLTFHIRLIPNGKFSSWLHHELKVGDTLFVQGPSGDCFYTTGNLEQNLLLIGTGTGLAPLYGIVKDAIKQGHTGEIHLFHGALNPTGLYLTEELIQLSQYHSNINYYPCVMNVENSALKNIVEGDIAKIALETIPKPAGWKSFLCGDENLVKQLKKKIFLAGSNMRDIYADAFIPSK